MLPPANSPTMRTLRELVDRAAVENNKAKFSELLAEITRTLDGSRKRHSAPMVAASNSEKDTFDIFSGMPDRDAVWVKAVDGIEEVKAQIEQIAADEPGDYFVFHVASREVLFQIRGTSSQSGGSQQDPPKSGAA